MHKKESKAKNVLTVDQLGITGRFSVMERNKAGRQNCVDWRRGGGDKCDQRSNRVYWGCMKKREVEEEKECNKASRS